MSRGETIGSVLVILLVIFFITSLILGIKSDSERFERLKSYCNNDYYSDFEVLGRKDNSKLLSIKCIDRSGKPYFLTVEE